MFIGTNEANQWLVPPVNLHSSPLHNIIIIMIKYAACLRVHELVEDNLYFFFMFMW